jgi:tetratricopeptide (TPR) repeat protein
MRLTVFRVLLAAFVAGMPASAFAQNQRAPDHMALGTAAKQARKPEEALRHFQAALAADSLNFDANCKAALAAADIVRQRPDDKHDPDGYYALGIKYARRAVAIDSTKAEGHLVLALTLGYDALRMAPESRLATAEEIWDEVHKALALDPKDDRSYHVLGRWHAELARFSWAKLIIRLKLHDLTDSVSWDAAAANMERAAQLAPKFIYHHLDLAETYVSMKRAADARPHLALVDSLPLSEVRDSINKIQAKELLAKIKND